MVKTSNGVVISKGRALVLFIVFVGSLVAVGLLVYFLADRPKASGSLNNGSVDTSTSVTSTSAKSAKLTTNIRLPRTVIPRHYDVRLLPILEKGNFSILGRVSIDVECMEETDRIILHSADIVVNPKSVRLIIKKGNTNNTKDQVLELNDIKYDTELEFLTIPLSSKGNKQKLSKGLNYTLSMDFVGNLNDQLEGFYRSSYTENGVEKFLAVSQMEPTDARRAFPCFDEPNMKATFSVTMGRHRDMKSLSNMPLINSTKMDGKEDFYWDHFEKSVPMSTYLIAFVVADFTKVESDEYNSKWGFNIYARPSAKAQTEYAREIGPRIQAFFEDYFQVPYPLPKQDMIAIPDFSAGAMENWGLITYRENYLLYDANISSASYKEDIASVIAHELAHQWFGNLVTMDWWTDLWLNEGFASYVQYIGGEFAEPSFEWSQQMVLDTVQGVMGLDALESSHPINIVVNHPDEIAEIFDGISYSKGASVIRMLANFLGEKTFRQGLTNYLNSKRYGNAVQDDLWESFTKQAKTDQVPLPATVKQIMDTWTLKMGFPVITVQREYSTNSKSKITLTQERFLMQRTNSSKEDKTIYLWWVPLTYTADFKTVETTWLAGNQTSKTFGIDLNVSNDQWIIFNINETGFFRVNYDQRNWQLITEQLMKDHTAINVINRAQIMNDAFNLARADLLDYDIVLNLTQYLERESEYLPWSTTLSSISYISEMMARSSGYGLLKKYKRQILSPLYNSLGFARTPSDAHLQIKLRSAVLRLACSKDMIKDCIEISKRSYAQWMADPNNDGLIPADLKRTIVCTALREGGEKEWDFAFNRYATTNIATEREVILATLSCSSDVWILSRLLDMSLNSTSGIRKQDAIIVIDAVSKNPVGRYLAFDFIRDRWKELKTTFASDLTQLGTIIASVSEPFNTPLQLKQLSELIEEHKDELGQSTRSTQQAVDRAKNNLNWMKTNYQKIVKWLKQHTLS